MAGAYVQTDEGRYPAPNTNAAKTYQRAILSEVGSFWKLAAAGSRLQTEPSMSNNPNPLTGSERRKRFVNLSSLLR